MLFECSSEVSSFNRYMLPGIANKTDQRSMLFRYPQQFVARPVGQQSPFVNGNNGVFKLRAFLRSEQKRFDWNGAKISIAFVEDGGELHAFYYGVLSGMDKPWGGVSWLLARNG